MDRVTVEPVQMCKIVVVIRGVFAVKEREKMRYGRRAVHMMNIRLGT